nr:hypothetical protein [Nostoc sp. DedSLP05]
MLTKQMTNQYETFLDEQKIADLEMLKTIEHCELLKNKQQPAQESWLSQERDENILEQVEISEDLLELITKARSIAEESRTMAELAQLKAKKAWAMAELVQSAMPISSLNRLY